MKELFVKCLLLLLCCFPVYGQVPQALNFQAVAYDDHGNELNQKPVEFKVELLQDSSTGTVVYSETHQTTTAANGVVNLLIGKGTAKSSSFETIDWSKSPYFVRLSMRMNGNASFREVATSQLLSVPYALYAEKAGNSSEGENEDFFVIGGDDIFAVGGGHRFTGGYSSFSISVLYMNGEEQNVNYRIEGLDESKIKVVEGTDTKSGPYGCHINLRFEYDYWQLQLEGYYAECKLILTNNKGKIKTLPFTFDIKMNKPEIPENPFETDEDVMNFMGRTESLYREYQLNLSLVDYAFIGESEDASYRIFVDKTYSSSDEEIESIWDSEYNLIDCCNKVINGLTSENISEEVRTLAINKAKFMRAHAYLLLTEWFDKVPLVLDSKPVDGYLVQSDRNTVLDAVIKDLTDIKVSFPGNIYILLQETYLLKGDWDKVIELGNLEAKTELTPFLVKIAKWKNGEGEGTISNESLMKEYLDTYVAPMDQFPYQQGNLFLNILDYTAEYFKWENGKHRKILPIPQSALNKNANIAQNPGY